MKKMLCMITLACSLVACGGGGGDGPVANQSKAVPTSSDSGPGDVERLFTFAKGTTWHYKVTSEFEGSTTVFTKRETVTASTSSGTRTDFTVEYVDDTPDAEIYQDNYFIDLGGLTHVSNVPSSDFTSAINPFREILFPVVPQTFVNVDKQSIPYVDVDQDGKPDTLDAYVTTQVLQWEAVTLSNVSYPRALKVLRSATYTIQFSGLREPLEMKSDFTSWIVPDVGVVKQVIHWPEPAESGLSVRTETRELTSFSSGGNN